MRICANRWLGLLIIRGDIAVHQQKPNAYQNQTTTNCQEAIAFHVPPLSNVEFCLIETW
jgi:hypothetical protein